MAERDLDRYLEGLGIDVDDDGRAEEPLLRDVEDDVPEPEPEYIDMETAISTYGIGGVIPDDLDARERTETFLVHLLLDLDAAYSVEVVDRGEEILAEISGGDAGRLIGKGGRTLAALEFLSNAVVNKGDADPIRVVIDVGGYKRRRDERLRQVAERAASRVRKGGREVELEPMSGAERRIVHMALADDVDVYTESTGEGRGRRVVVKPAD